MRPLVALMALAAALSGSGQSCFRVVEEDTGDGLSECTVWCTSGEGPWYTAPDGLVCLPLPCDSVRIEKVGYQTACALVTAAQKRGSVGIRSAESTLLKEVVIEHWPRKRDRQALAATATLDSTLIAGFERASLRSAAQWTPGVQWDERGHGGSARLSIRGSLLRSPFGVRGVKVYWGPFPLTLADGSTPLEVLDPLLVGSLDIIRSVGSPMYGSAPSGLLLANGPFRSTVGTDAAVEGTGGSWGYYRLGAISRSNRNGKLFTAGLVHQRNGGYRAQESSARDQAFIASSFTIKKSVTQIFLTWQKASWDLPGSVDERTAEDDPRAARPYSELLDAHIAKEQVLGGLANELRIGEDITVRSTIHGQLIDKINPYGTTAANCGYKEESIRAIGGRLSIGGSKLFSGPTTWDVGLEALTERDRLRERSYVDGTIGDRKVDGETRVANMNAFVTTVTRIGPRSTLFAGAGLERTLYDHTDKLVDTRCKLRTDPRALPYVGVEHVLGAGCTLHLRYAESVSRSTVWELLGSSGQFNDDLRGEQVREWEFGASNELTGSAVRADVTVYHRLVKDLITQRQLIDGRTAYENQDVALVAGWELLVRGPLYQTGVRRLDLLASMAITATDLHSTDPTAGKKSLGDIPGIPLLTAGLIARTSGIGVKGLGLEVGSRLIGSTPTGGSNITDKHVEHVRLAYLFHPRGADFSIFLHCENLFDARYSGWIHVNDPGQRYFNPAPGRSLYFGIRVTINDLKGGQAD